LSRASDLESALTSRNRLNTFIAMTDLRSEICAFFKKSSTHKGALPHLPMYSSHRGRQRLRTFTED